MCNIFVIAFCHICGLWPTCPDVDVLFEFARVQFFGKPVEKAHSH